MAATVCSPINDDKINLKLTELLGRKSDIIYLPSGKVAPGLTFYYILRAILEKSHNIKEFIGIRGAPIISTSCVENIKIDELKKAIEII